MTRLTRRDHPERAALEAAIAADPDDAQLYAVYADWLQARADPRGELIALEHALAKEPKSWRLRARRDDLFEALEPELLGALADVRDMLPRLEWRQGFLHAATVANTFARGDDEGEDGDDDSPPRTTVEDVIAMLLDADAASLLQVLTVGIVTFTDNSYGGVIAALAGRRLPHLRSLFLGAFSCDETELNWSSLGDASPLYPAAPNLRRLVLRSGSMSLGEIRLPELRELELITGGLTRDELGSIARAHWPRLEKLSIQIGSPRYGSDVTIDDLRALLEEDPPPALRHLGLANSEHTDQICELLARSKVLPRLAELDLSLGTMGIEGARAIAEHAAAFRHLERLDVSDNWIDAEGQRLLRDVCANVILGGQQEADDPGDRYIAAGE